MDKVYWITRLDVIYAIGLFFCVAGGILLLLIITLNYTLGDFEDFAEHLAKLKKTCRVVLSFFVIGLLTVIFVPTTKEMCAIYVFGNTIDYIEGSDKIQEIPDKVVNIAYEYVEGLEDKVKDSKKK